jgi:hypothetical protein
MVHSCAFLIATRCLFQFSIIVANQDDQEYESLLSADVGVGTQELASHLCQTANLHFVPRPYSTTRHHPRSSVQ